MTALSTDRNTPSRILTSASLPLAANTRIFAGSLVALNSSGYLVPVTNTGSASTLRVIGRAMDYVDNRTAVGSGGAGDLSCRVEYGTFRWENSTGGDEITLAHLGQPAYAQDDQTVAATSDGGDRPSAGRIVDVDDAGVWVWHAPIFVVVGDGALLAANDLSDLNSAATALGNLGALAESDDRRLIFFQRLPLNADGVFRYVHRGPDATISSIASVVDGATTTTGEDCTVAASIGGTPVTNGTVTIAGASAAGTTDLAEPSAANVLTEGDVLELTVTDGSQVAASFANVTVELVFA